MSPVLLRQRDLLPPRHHPHETLPPTLLPPYLPWQRIPDSDFDDGHPGHRDEFLPRYGCLLSMCTFSPSPSIPHLFTYDPSICSSHSLTPTSSPCKQIPFHATWTNWMYKTPPVKCINLYACVYVAAGMSIFHDLVILCMPLPQLWSLHLSWRKHMNLIFMFSIGGFVVVCSALRLPSLMKLKGSSDPSCEFVLLLFSSFLFFSLLDFTLHSITYMLYHQVSQCN